jgi:hypothetical protein
MDEYSEPQTLLGKVLRGILSGFFFIQAIIWPVLGLGFLAALTVIGVIELRAAIRLGDRGFIIGTSLLVLVPFVIGAYLVHALRGEVSPRVTSKIGPLFYLTFASLLGIILGYENPILLVTGSIWIALSLALTYRVRKIWKIRRALFRALIMAIILLAIFSKQLGPIGLNGIFVMAYGCFAMPGLAGLFELWRLLPGPRILITLRRGLYTSSMSSKSLLKRGHYVSSGLTTECTRTVPLRGPAGDSRR